MGTVAVQTQCCLKTDESEDEDSSTAQEGTAVQVVDALHWGNPLLAGLLRRLLICRGRAAKRRPSLCRDKLELRVRLHTKTIAATINSQLHSTTTPVP